MSTSGSAGRNFMLAAPFDTPTNMSNLQVIPNPFDHSEKQEDLEGRHVPSRNPLSNPLAGFGIR
jgi:hypothetical protein